MSPLFLFSLFTIASGLCSVLALNQDHITCGNPFSCADKHDLYYPFWGSDRPGYCGPPGFELNCTGDVPEITIMAVPYRVLDIDFGTLTLTLSRKDYTDTLCSKYNPPEYKNSTFDSKQFKLASNARNITIYYDCSNSILDRTLGQFSCRFLDDMSYFGLSSSFGELGSCHDVVTTPISELGLQSVERNPSQGDLVRAMKDGFGLHWYANKELCDKCRKTAGVCGYDDRTRSFACHCPNESTHSTCGSVTKKLRQNLIIGVSVAGSVVGVSLLACVCFLIYRRRKKIEAQYQSKDIKTPPLSKATTATSTIFSRSTPSFLSSKSDVEYGSTYFGAQVFTSTELEEATANFDSSKELGDGGFGTVYYGLLKDGRAVAVKRLYENNLKRVEQFMTEIEILTRLRHPNLVTLYGCTSRQSRELLLVYEYISNGTVADHLHGNRTNSNRLTWPLRLDIAIETASALTYLHISDVIHRDVKTNNILLDSNFHVKVADFGLSRLFPTDVTHVSTAPQGTPGYVDPDYYQCYQITSRSDVYSFGVVLCELISSKPAVDITRHRHDINLSNMALNRIQNHLLHELVDTSLGFETDYGVKSMITSVAELAFRCLQQERDLRPSMEEVLEILKGIKNEDLRIQKAEVVDTSSDDTALLKNCPPPPSPGRDNAVSISISTAGSSF